MFMNSTYWTVTSENMFNKFMSTSEGKEAVATMVKHGKDDHHFRFLTKQEAEQLLKQPYNFVSQTASWKEASLTTKIRHVSNPSCLNKQVGSSHNIVQRNPGNISNNFDWPMFAFMLYSIPYAADVISAFRKLQVKEEDRRFQPLVFFKFE